MKLDKGETSLGGYIMYTVMLKWRTSCDNGDEKENSEKREDGWVFSDRLLFLKISAHPVYILVIQVYMSTSDHEYDEVKDV